MSDKIKDLAPNLSLADIEQWLAEPQLAMPEYYRQVYEWLVARVKELERYNARLLKNQDGIISDFLSTIKRLGDVLCERDQARAELAMANEMIAKDYARRIEARDKDACRDCDGKGGVGYTVETDYGPEGDSEICPSCVGTGSQMTAEAVGEIYGVVITERDEALARIATLEAELAAREIATAIGARGKENG